MALNKRGVFFTLMAIVILSIFIVSFVFISGNAERKATEKRVESLNNFVFAIEDDLPRQLYISGFRIIFLLENELAKNGNYVNDLNAAFNEAFFNGTVNGEAQELMNDATFHGIETLMKEKAAKINANVSLEKASVSVTQDEPWNVKVRLTANLVVEDLSGLASWNRTAFIDSYIPIESFNDPLYVASTNGLILNKMVKTPYSSFDNIEDLREHAENSYYIASATGPSFLDRLQGINGGGAAGVESFVNLQELSSQGIAAKSGKSVVDYIYFSSNPADGCSVAGMQSWFRIDSSHLGNYGVACSG